MTDHYKENEYRCQFPVGECHPCGPWACNKGAPEERGEWHFCTKHAIEYDKENSNERPL